MKGAAAAQKQGQKAPGMPGAPEAGGRLISLQQVLGGSCRYAEGADRKSAALNRLGYPGDLTATAVVRAGCGFVSIAPAGNPGYEADGATGAETLADARSCKFARACSTGAFA